MSSVLGTVSAGQLLAALVRSVEEQGAMLVAQRAEREERVSAGGGGGRGGGSGAAVRACGADGRRGGGRIEGVYAGWGDLCRMGGFRVLP